MINRYLSPMMVLFVLVMVFQPVEARVKGPRLDSASAGCGIIQDQLDQIIKDAKKAAKNNDKQAWDAAIAKGRSLVNDWRSLGCDSAFGRWWTLALERDILFKQKAPGNAGVYVPPTRVKPGRGFRQPALGGSGAVMAR